MSDWKESANRRRDSRQSKTESRPVANSRKDTKRWCRGKTGVEHEKRCMPWKGHGFTLACTKCGKQFEWWFDAIWARQPKPAWVTG